MKVYESSVPQYHFSQSNGINHHYSIIVSQLNNAIKNDNFASLTCKLREFPTFDLRQTMGEPAPPLHVAASIGSKELLKFLLTQTTIHPDAFCATPQTEQSALSIAASRRDASIVQMFLNAGADVNNVDYQTGKTPLIWAARVGDVKKIEILCDAGADLEHVDAQENTALRHALISGHDAAIRALLERGASLDGRHSAGTSMFLAISEGQPAVLKALLDFGADVNREKNIVGITSLMCAAGMKNSVEIMQILLDAGANINAKDRRGYTVVMAAAEAGDAKMIRALSTRHEIDVNATSHHKTNALLPRNIQSPHVSVGPRLRIDPHQTMVWHSTTALMDAVYYNHVEAVEALIDAGARVNARDDQSNTVLIYAAKYASPEIISMLCKKGALTELTNGAGASALHYAVIRGELGVVGALIAGKANVNATVNDSRSTILMVAAEKSSKAMISMLVRAGAKVDAESSIGLTALTLAIFNGKPDSVKELLALGANPNGCHEAIKIPLLIAVSTGRKDLVSILIEAGADVNALDDDKQTALMFAAVFAHPNLLKYLLLSGADRSLRSAQGLTALDFAQQSGVEASVEILRINPAKRQRVAL